MRLAISACASPTMCSEELSRVSIAGDAQAQTLGTRVVGVVAPGLGRQRIKTAVSILIPESRSRDRQVERLDPAPSS